MTDYRDDPTCGLSSATQIDAQTFTDEAAQHLRDGRIVMVYGAWFHGAEDAVAALAAATGAFTQPGFPEWPDEQAWKDAMNSGRGIVHHPGAAPENLPSLTFSPGLWADENIRTRAIEHLAPRFYRVHIDRYGDGQETYWSYDSREALAR